MSLNPIHNKWVKERSLGNNSFYNIWKPNYNKSSDWINDAFSGNIQAVGNKITADLDMGTIYLNEYTTVAIAKAFYNNFLINSKTKKVLLSSDNSDSSNLLLDIFASELKSEKITVIRANDFATIPTVYKQFIASEEKCEIVISFQNPLGNQKRAQILFNYSDGSAFSKSDMQKIVDYINKVDYLNINLPALNNNYEYSDAIDAYLEQVHKRYSANELLNKNSLPFGIDSSRALNKEFFTSNLKYFNLPFFTVNRAKNANFYYANHHNYLQRINWKGIGHRSKANFIINEEGTGLNFSIKHKSVLKYFKPDEIAALYLNFLINDDPEFNKETLQNSFIAKNYFAGSLTHSIALENNIEVFEFVNRSNVWKYVAQNSEMNLLLAFTSSSEFVANNRLTNSFDANLFLFEVLRMINFYKKHKNQDLFEVLGDLYKKYKRHHLTIHTYEIDLNGAVRFFERIKSATKFGSNLQITRVQKIENDNNIESNSIYKISFRNREYAYIHYSQQAKAISFYCNTIERSGEQNGETMMVVRNNEMLEGLLELKEENTISKFSVKSVLKYLAYSLFLIGIIIFLFYSVYNLKDEFGASAGGPSEVFKAFYKKLYVKNDITEFARPANAGYIARASFVFLSFGTFIWSIFQALIFKRVITLQGDKVKWRDIFVGTIIGIVVQTITPKSIGGDIATYWYLRRRNVPRASLMSAIVVNSFIWQLGNIISTAIFVPIGIKTFSSFFVGSNPNSITFIVMLVLGLIFDTGWTTLLLVITLNKKLQRFALRALIAIIEITPFIRAYDSFAIKAKFEYELFNINKCIKKTFKNPYYLFELVLLKFVPSLLTFNAFQAQALGIVKPDVPHGYYWNLTIQNTMIRVANSISFTPGGTGTADYLYKVLIRESIQSTSYDGATAFANSSIMTALNTLGFVVIGTLISAIILVLVYIGEKRIDHYRKKNKNNKLLATNLADGKIKMQSTYYKIVFPIVLIALVSLSLTFILVN
ncbi:flippase-like domain-containing protein [Mycoplasmopsis agalactiae]|uniref:lysylphosphatidylglycerol synthase transmembrane domain-containing protein n=1 Tax=Mycoplasmopsis agalactiae TaxID=2110 RepID=UPI00211C124D|nr:lysylphosphatidylglycerol synthase transmembrane domain-containing protein [Mycoplasmopsis agalactiae]UUM25413.1 flippase-like domain-containing protein [Mycoplasmopsis agalactiae]